VALLQDIIDITVPGQQINAAREKRAQREAAEAARQREAQAFEAISSGDVMGAAAFDPRVASQYQQVQGNRLTQRDAADQLRTRALTRAVRAGRGLAERIGDPLAAFDMVSKNAGRLFGVSPEEAQQARALVEQGGFDALENALVGPQEADTRGRYISTRNGIFDTQSQQIVEGTRPAGDPLDREYRLAQIDATEALAEQRRARTGADARIPETAGTKKLDQEFAKETSDYLSGGASVAASNVARLDNAIEQLSARDDLSGPAAGALPIAVRSVVNPRSAAVQQQVQNAIQESLKATLGAQFARVEGEQLLDRAFDPRQQEQENIRRVSIVAATLRDQLDRKQEMVDYFTANGTLRGYEGPRPDPQAFNDLLRQFEREDRSFGQDDASGGEGMPQAAVEAGVDAADWQYMTDEQKALFE